MTEAEIETLAELPTTIARHWGEKTALLAHDRRITFEELDLLSNRIGNRLLADASFRGARIAVLARDSAASLPLLFGAAKAKAVWMGLNWRLSVDELSQILQDAEPRVIFYEPMFADTLSQVLARTGLDLLAVALADASPLGETWASWLGDAGQGTPNLSYDPDDVVVQLYTSGTTGLPKGVQLASRSFFALPDEMRRREQPFLGWNDQDVSLLFVPTFYVAALWWLVRGLALASTTVVLPSFDPGQALRAIQDHRVTVLGLVPAMLQMLLNDANLPTCDLSSLRAILYGGSPISLPLLERAQAVLACDLYQAYGMTETGNLVACLEPAEHRKRDALRLQSAGRPLPGVRLRIVDDRGDDVPVGEVGEVLIRTPGHMHGYWNQPEATRATLIDGWVRSGDLGRIDADGFLYIVDRRKDMIIAAGENIYPAEVEKALRTNPAVGDVAVIGIPHETWGEEIMAFIVPRPDTALSVRDVAVHARAHLAAYKVPTRVELVSQLPRNVGGKVLKTVLREPYWKGRTRQVN
jgi:acyl-CoA synthetase (AMP-forming)/AMP-acid ligase II